MSDWELLRTIIADWKNTAIMNHAQAASLFNKLDSNIINRAANELCRNMSDNYVNIFSELITLAQSAFKLKSKHPAIGWILDNCLKLAQAGKFIQITLTFSFEILLINAKNNENVEQAAKAFDVLIAGLNEENENLARTSSLLLSILLPRLNNEERRRMLDAIENLPEKFREKTLLNTLKEYVSIVDRAEESVAQWKQNMRFPPIVISVHSHKGGVGKTTVAAALAITLSKGHKVCVVDCDTDGPSLFFSLPFKKPAKKSVLFFIDWLNSDTNELPLEKIPKTNINGKDIYCIPGSFLPSDINLLAELQHGGRPENANYFFLQSRIMQLLEKLYDHGFDCVIFDTGPGLSNLSMDVLNVTFQTGGAQIFVMRPRIVDITEFCIEWDWLYFLERKQGQSTVLINFAKPGYEYELILKNKKKLVNIMKKYPQLQIYNDRLFAIRDKDSTDNYFAMLIADMLNERVTFDVLTEEESFRHAEDILTPLSKNLAEGISKNQKIRKFVDSINNRFES